MIVLLGLGKQFGEGALGKFIFALVILTKLAHLNAAAATPKYNPYGVQNDVPVSHVLEGGWRVLYKGLYSEGMPSVPDLFRGACDQIMLASKRVDSPLFDILATVEADLYLPLDTPRHVSVRSNGARWYKNNQSMGFAGSEDAVSQNSADTNGLTERDRLSWHTIQISKEPDNRLNPGWRSGDNIRLDKSNQWERFILTTTQKSSEMHSEGNQSCSPMG